MKRVEIGHHEGHEEHEEHEELRCQSTPRCSGKVDQVLRARHGFRGFPTACQDWGCRGCGDSVWSRLPELPFANFRARLQRIGVASIHV